MRCSGGLGLEPGLPVNRLARRERGEGRIGRGCVVVIVVVVGFEDVGEPFVDRRSRGSVVLQRRGRSSEGVGFVAAVFC